MVLRQLGRKDDLSAVRRLDPLDPWSRWLRNPRARLDTQTRLDLAHDLARAGFVDEVVGVLAAPAGSDVRDLGAEPMRLYTLGWIEEGARLCGGVRTRPSRGGGSKGGLLLSGAAGGHRGAGVGDAGRSARCACTVLSGQPAVRPSPACEAIRMRQRAASRYCSYPTVWRNLGIGYFNIQGRATGRAPPTTRPSGGAERCAAVV